MPKLQENQALSLNPPRVGGAGGCLPRAPEAPDTAGRLRIAGVDLARALAVLGMILVNIRYLMEAEENGPEWLVRLIAIFDGRPAALFTVLAGVSLSLMQRSGPLAAAGTGFQPGRSVVLKRAVFLFALGLLFIHIWPPDILHFYAVYFVICAFLLRASNRLLAALIVCALAVGSMLLIGFEFLAGADFVDIEDPQFWTPAGMLGNLFIAGYYPVFPWLAFVLLGICLGRMNWLDRSIRRRMMVAGITVLCLSESAALVLKHLYRAHTFVTDIPMISYFFKAYPFPPTAVYLLSAGATAVLVIDLCVIFTATPHPRNWLSPVLSVGRMALSVYVAHIILGYAILWATNRLDSANSLVLACLVAAGLAVAVLVLSHLWLMHFRHGPLEWLMRWISS
jgi:uncharacterized membrane protein YeiB